MPVRWERYSFLKECPFLEKDFLLAAADSTFSLWKYHSPILHMIIPEFPAFSFVVFIGIAFAVASASLSHLVLESAKYEKKTNDNLR